MPSSRASSPLSSAVPSPPPSLTPRRSPSVRSLSSASVGSERAQRSPTSSTAPLSHASAGGSDDESDLTEEEEEEEVEHRSSPPPPVLANEDAEELSEEDGDEVLTVVSKARSRDRRNRINSQTLSSSPSLSASPSLTPPPPSALLKTKVLSPSPSAAQAIPEAEPGSDISDDGDDVDDRAVSRKPEVDQNVQTADPAEDAEGDEEAMEEGDVTMRAVEADDEGAAEAEEKKEQEEVGQPERTHDRQEVADGVPDVVVEEHEASHEHPDGQAEEDENDDGESEHPDSTTHAMPARAFHSSHAPPPSSAQLRSLLTLELKFAALRDKLYIERMEEAAAEEQMILDGTHPALQFLHKTLADRRERLHEVASRRHFEALGELKRAREADKMHTWSWWTEQRDQLHWEEFDRTWSKRRRLAREKNEIETPRFVKPVPRVGDRTRGVDWSTGVAPAKISASEAANDLSMMELRPVQMQQNHMLSRHASPAIYAPPMSQQPPPQASNMMQPVAAPGPSTRPPPAQTAQAAPTFPYNSMPSYHNNPPRTIQTVQANTQPPGLNRVQQTQTHPQHIPQSHAQQQQQQQQLQQQQQPRPQGRLVPTTSDLFESGRKDAAASTMPWNKPDIKNTNGHAKDPLLGTTKPEERPPSRFPGLNEYMTSTKPATATIPPTGTGYASILTAGAKMLSPPKPPSNSLLGSFGARPPASFGSTQNTNAATAGTTTARP